MADFIPLNFSFAEAAAYLGIGESLLRELHEAGKGPVTIKIQSRVLFPREELEAWNREHVGRSVEWKRPERRKASPKAA